MKTNINIKKFSISISIFLILIFFTIFFTQRSYCESSNLFPVQAKNGYVELYLTEPEKYSFGNSIIEKKLIELIDNSKNIITIFAFDFDNANLLEALIEASRRGVKIRIICDLKNTPSNVLKIFDAQNWLVYYKSKKLMHHKIIIFDEKIVGLGSMNFAISCMYSNNNDFYLIKNENIAKMFESYFDYLAYGKNKDLLRKPQTIDGITFYFTNSPYYNINDYISGLIEKANKRIVFAYSTFTNDILAKKIIKNVEDKKLFFFGILEKRNAYSKYSVYNTFLNNNLHIYLDRNDYYMHHKLMIIDNLILTGSYAISDRQNTEKSIEFNDDLAFCLEDDRIADFLVEYLKSLVLR